MATSRAASVDGGISVLSKLASVLRQAEDITGQIDLHPSLQGAIAQLVKSSQPIPEREIADVVQALDDENQDDDAPTLSSRLGIKTFVHIFAVLRVSQGLDETDPSEPNTQASGTVLDNASLISRKARIGADILRMALKQFCNHNVEDGARRWMGLLTIELLKNCKENVSLVETEPEDRRHMLGNIIIEGQNELLRYVAGSVIRQLICEGVSASLFWSTNIGNTIHGVFFESQAQSSQWLELFESHLDEIDTQNKAHEHKVAFFSYMLKLGRKTYRSRAVDSPSVLVTLHRILSIVIPERVSKSGHTEPAQYVDIPLENISEMDIREAPEERLKVSAENHVKSILDIHLVKEACCTFYVNARAHQQPFVCLAFDTASVADDLKSLISSQKSLIRPGSITNRSPLNVSQNDLTRISGSRLVGGGYPFILDAFQGGSTDKLLKGSKHPSIVAVGTSDAAHDEEEILAEMVQVVDPQRLVATATRFNNLLTQGPALIPLDPRSAATVSDPNPSPSASRHPRVRVSDGGSPIDPNLAGIEGDPGPRFGPAQPRGQKPVRISEGVLTDSQSFHYTGDLLDQSYTSTAQWRDGASTIEHAPEFSEVVYDSFKLNEPMPEDVEQSMSPESDRSGDSRRLNGVHGVPHRVANNPATRLPTQTSGGLGSLAARVNTSTGARKALALKVSQRLLGRQGERIRPTKAAGDESPATKPQEASKSGRVSTKNVPTKQSPPKIKTTYKSKDRKEVQQSASKEQPVGPTGEASVFDIPSSPTKTARKPLKSKPSKPAATDAKPSEKSSTQAKRKTKQPTKASAGKATTSKDASVPPIQDKEDPEHDNSKQNIADKNDDNRKSRPSKRKSGTPERPGASTVSEKEDAPKETTAQVAKQPPAETTESGPKTTAASKKHKSAPALLRHPERRRVAAINANQKIQGISTKAGETPQDNGETLGNPGHVEGVHDDDRADEAEDEDQGVSDIIGGSDASKGNSATNSVVLMEPVVDSAIGNGHVDEQVPQPQDVPEVLRADQPNMRVPNIEPSAATALRTVNGARKVQMITATTEEIQAATKPYIHKNDTPTIPAANTISLEVSVDLLDTEGQLDRSGGSIQRHIEAITDGGPLPDAGVPPLENTIEATTTSSKSPRVNLDTAAKDFRFKEVANGAESYGVSGKYTTRLDPNLHLRGVAATDGPIFQKEIPIGKATESTTQGLRTTLVLESKVPSANQTLSKIMKDNLERTEQVIQISSAEEASPESDARSLQKDIMPTISQHRYNKKRKSEDIIEDSVKRTKHSTPGPAQKARAPEEMDAIATDGYIQRKSVIIGFDAKGPRNQGVYSGKRPKTFAIPHGPESGFSRNTPSLSVKRKHPDEQESNVPSGAPRRAMKTPAEKRRRMVTVVPPTPGESSRNFSQVTSPNLASQSHKMSSQGSRVLDNGSPIAAGDQVRRVNRVDVDHLLRHLSNKEDDDLFMADSLNRDDEDEAPNDSLWEAELPLPTRPHKFPQPASIQALKHYERRSSSNTKALPSSPTAPSRMLEAMTAHKIADDGRFVNVHTATVLTAAEPQDPFMDNSHNLPNPFLTMLRASTQEDGGKREKCAKKTSITQRAGVDDSAPLFDPDRTLVEVDPRHYGRLPPSSHGKPSSSPPSISNRSSLPSESDKDETRAELAQMWMEALRPHQRGALASLHEMSNRLMRHLNSKESVIDDAVRDFDLGGNKLLDALMDAHGESQENHLSSVGKAKQSLTISYGDIEKRLGQEVNEVKRGRVADMEKKWRQQQQQDHGYLNAALLAYGG